MQASTLLFATSRPTMRISCGILPLPSLLVRAFTPMQLFGLRKTPDLSLASPQGSPLVATSSGQRRAVARTTARSPNLSHLADTRWHHRASGRTPVLPDGLWAPDGV